MNPLGIVKLKKNIMISIDVEVNYALLDSLRFFPSGFGAFQKCPREMSHGAPRVIRLKN